MKFAILLALLQPPEVVDKPVTGAASLSLPAKVTALPGDIFAVVAETNCKWIRFTVPAGLRVVPPQHSAYGQRAVVAYGPAGSYELKAEGTLNDQFVEAKCVVTVGTPPEPVPNDPTLAVLRRLYADDKGADKANSLAQLTSIYRVAALNAVKDPSLSTSSQLFQKLRAVSSALLPDEALRPIREELKKEVEKCFPADVPLTDELREKAAACFRRIAGLLDAAK